MKHKAKKHLKYKGNDYRPGETFDAPAHDTEAKHLVDQGHAEVVDTEAGEAAAAQAQPPDPKTNR